MASLQKNVASQFFTFTTVGSTSGAVTTSTSTSQFNSLAFLSTGTTQSSLAGTFTSLGNGQWAYAPTQGETNYVSVGYLFEPANTVPVNFHFFTDVVDSNGLLQVDLVDIAGAAVATGSAQLGVNLVNIAGSAVATGSAQLGVNVVNIGGVAASSSSTQLWINVADFGGVAVTGRDIGASVLLSSGTGAGQVSINSGIIDANTKQIGGVTASASSTQLWVNVVNFGGTAVTGRDIGASVLLSSGTGTGQLDIIAGIAQVNTIQFAGTTVTARDIGASVLLSSGTGTGQLNLSSGNVTVATNNDKTGYTLTATAYSSFADVILDRDMSLGVDSGSSSVRTPRQAFRVLRNKVDTSSGTTLVVYKEDDATQSWTASITVSSSAQPIVTLTPP